MMKDDLTEAMFGEDEALPDPVEIEPDPSPEAAEAPPSGEDDTPPAPEPQAEPPASNEPAPAPPPAAEPGHVPLAAVLDEREKRQKLERELEDLRARQAQPQAQTKVPDQFLEPDAYQAYVQAQQADAQWQVRLDVSQMMAIEKYGEDEVRKAAQWFAEREAKDPSLVQAVRSQLHPLDYAVREYRRHQLIEGAPFDADAAALARHYAARAGIPLADVQAPATPAQPTQPIRTPQPRPLPPASIVDKPSQPVEPHAQSRAATQMVSKLFEAE